jgi:hypothetical protein
MAVSVQDTREGCASECGSGSPPGSRLLNAKSGWPRGIELVAVLTSPRTVAHTRVTLLTLRLFTTAFALRVIRKSPARKQGLTIIVLSAFSRRSI